MNGSQQYVNGTYLILVYYIFADLIMCGDHAMTDEDEDRRKFLATCGKFAVVTPPAITMLLSTSLTSDAIAASNNSFAKGNNGPGNGVDGQPPGNPPINDGPGTSPGNPGNQGGVMGGRQNLP